jgi:hypothetical protein
MAVPWLVVGQLVLSNLDKIIGVVKPGGFTRKKEGAPVQNDLLNQQIAELQSAASNNAEQLAALATQLKDVVAALEQAGQEAVAQRAAVRRLAYVAMGIAIIAILLGAGALVGCSTMPVGTPKVSSLAGLRLEVPCADHFNQDTECHWDKSLLQTADPRWKLKREIVRSFGGTPGVTYDVAIHARGIVEPKNFTGGEVKSEHFQTGGEPVKNDYNFYSLHVSDPEATYTFNRHERKVGHYTFPIDYRVTIPVRSGATLTMGAYDSNDVAIANHERAVIAGLPPAPAPYDGQFFQLDVESISAQR